MHPRPTYSIAVPKWDAPRASIAAMRSARARAYNGDAREHETRVWPRDAGAPLNPRDELLAHSRADIGSAWRVQAWELRKPRTTRGTIERSAAATERGFSGARRARRKCVSAVGARAAPLLPARCVARSPARTKAVLPASVAGDDNVARWLPGGAKAPGDSEIDNPRQPRLALGNREGHRDISSRKSRATFVRAVRHIGGVEPH
jgi:hypothetical protein